MYHKTCIQYISQTRTNRNNFLFKKKDHEEMPKIKNIINRNEDYIDGLTSRLDTMDLKNTTLNLEDTAIETSKIEKQREN